MLLRKKRGISPLIASVLLIGFAIAIAALIFIWWGDYVKQQSIKEGLKLEAEKACLSDLNFEVKDVKETAEGLKFTINNKGSQKINGFRFRIEDDNGIITVTKASEINGISQGIVLLTTKDYSGSNPKEAEVLPIIIKSSEEGNLAYTCTNVVTKIKIKGGE